MLKVKKSKPILICAISLALCAMGSLTAVAVNHIGNDQNQSATVIAANEVCAMDNVQEVEVVSTLTTVVDVVVTEVFSVVVVDNPAMSLYTL